MDWGLIALGFLVAYIFALFWFLGRYVWRSRWRSSTIGPVLAYFLGLNAIGWLGIVGLVCGPPSAVTEVAFAVVFGALLTVMVRLNIMLARAQRIERNHNDD